MVMVKKWQLQQSRNSEQVTAVQYLADTDVRVHSIHTLHKYDVVQMFLRNNQGHREFPFQDCKIPPQSKNIHENSRYWNHNSPSSGQQHFI